MPNEPELFSLEVTVNGTHHRSEAIEARLTLADFLRHCLQLTGTHVGCEHGVCGACTVLVDGQLTRSCLTFAIQMNGAEITTVEGLAANGQLAPIQQAFKECHGLQCGFCTPGFLITCEALLRENSSPSEKEIREWLSGNICRCTGYQFIVDACLLAAQRIRETAAL